MPHTAKTSQVTCAGMIFCLCFGNCWGRRAIDNVEAKVETGIHTVSTSSSASAGKKGFSSSAKVSRGGVRGRARVRGRVRARTGGRAASAPDWRMHYSYMEHRIQHARGNDVQEHRHTGNFSSHAYNEGASLRLRRNVR